MGKIKIEKTVKIFKIKEIKEYLEKKFNKKLFLELISFDIYEDYDKECFCGDSRGYIIIGEDINILGDPYMVAFDSEHAFIYVAEKGEAEYKLDTIFENPKNGIYAILDGPLINNCTMIDPTKICIEDSKDKEALTIFEYKEIPLYNIELSEKEIKEIIFKLDFTSDRELIEVLEKALKN